MVNAVINNDRFQSPCAYELHRRRPRGSIRRYSEFQSPCAYELHPEACFNIPVRSIVSIPVRVRVASPEIERLCDEGLKVSIPVRVRVASSRRRSPSERRKVSIPVRVRVASLRTNPSVRFPIRFNPRARTSCIRIDVKWEELEPFQSPCAYELHRGRVGVCSDY